MTLDWDHNVRPNGLQLRDQLFLLASQERIPVLYGVAILLFVVKVEAEPGFRLRTRNLDWNLCARSILAEEWVDWLQQD